MQAFAVLFGNVDALALLPSDEALETATESGVFWPIYGALMLATAAGAWATFVKAGQRGWTCIIPIYNLVVLLKIVRMHPAAVVLFFLPLVNLIFSCFIAIRLARAFGKGFGFGLGLVCFPYIYYPVLGFGAARHQGPGSQVKDAAAPAASQTQYRKAG